MEEQGIKKKKQTNKKNKTKQIWRIAILGVSNWQTISNPAVGIALRRTNMSRLAGLKKSFIRLLDK